MVARSWRALNAILRMVERDLGILIKGLAGSDLYFRNIQWIGENRTGDK